MSRKGACLQSSDETLAQIVRHVGTPPRGMFSALRRQARVKPPYWLTPTDLLSRIFDNQKKILRDGGVHWAATIHANASLFRPGGGTSSAQVVYAPDNDLTLNNLRLIASRLYSFKNRIPSDPALGRIGRMLADEMERALDWPIPATVTGGPRVITTAVIITRTFVPGRMLAMGYFPIVSDPRTSLALLIPSKFWPESLVSEWSGGVTGKPIVAAPGQLVLVTAAAAARIRRTSVNGCDAMEIRCFREGGRFRYALDLVPTRTRCVASCQSEGVSVLIPDRYTLKLIRGTVIDCIGGHFTIDNPNLT